jgi:hypothetical protein
MEKGRGTDELEYTVELPSPGVREGVGRPNNTALVLPSLSWEELARSWLEKLFMRAPLLLLVLQLSVSECEYALECIIWWVNSMGEGILEGLAKGTLNDNDERPRDILVGGEQAILSITPISRSFNC